MERDADIAVIGVGCRFPGADNIDEFWRVLVNGENHVLDIPPERWNNAAFYSENPDEPGKYYTKKAGLLNRHDEWDNSLFGINDTEAERVDPQHRYVLECTQMAMVDGGITRKQLSGTRTGVYIGAMNDDYKSLSNLDHDEDTNYTATGMSTTIIAARVSYVYNLQGPCMVVDTACSSSITAIHLASEAIRSGECDMAICGGVNSLLCPDVFITLSRAKILSQIGQCQTFCDTADGYARAEGCGVVIIKSLKKALQDKNKIWGVVRTGINQDGRTVQPITTPSGDQHEQLFKQVYSRYNVDPTNIQYIEAHGTGTRVGDPTEVNALGRFIHQYKNGLDKENAMKNNNGEFKRTSEIDVSKNGKRILIGSVKTNIGHSEAAAGMSGLIKVLLMMKNGSYVPSLHIRKDKSNLNKNIKLDEYGFDITVQTEEWKTNEKGQRICCINSFGFGGSNSHAIVIQIPDNTLSDPKTTESDCLDKWVPICVSAPKRDSLKAAMESLSTDLNTEFCSLQDVSYTSIFHRDHYSCRTLLFGTNKDEVKEQLARKLENIDQIQSQQKNRIIFVFCGVGTTWRGMCKEMVATQPVFKDTMVKIDHFLKPLTGWSILTKIDEEDFTDPILNHVAIFCTQVGLHELWKSWGVYPEAIVGQSVGEVAAAYASGALCLEDAVSVIYYRSKELAEILSGTMLVVGNISVQNVEKMCDKYARRVTIAVYNSPNSCTLSGDADVVDKIVDEIEVLNRERSPPILIKRLTVPCAYHSHHVDASKAGIKNHLQTIRKRRRETDHYSTVTGQLAVADEFQTGQYWADNARKPVRFMEAIEAAAQNGLTNVYVEIGPRPVLKAHLKHVLGDKFKGICLPSMTLEKECHTAFSSLGSLYELGAVIKWGNFHLSGKAVHVPRYVFNKSKTLFVPIQKQQIMMGVPPSNNLHMYVRNIGAYRESFQIKLDRELTPFIFDHHFLDTVIVPGATYVEAAFDIGQKKTDRTVYELDISTEFCSRLSPENDEELLIEAEVSTDNNRNGHHYAFKDRGRILCQGYIYPRAKHSRSAVDLAPIMSRCKIHRNKVESYECLALLKLRYGETLGLIQQSWTSSKECVAEIIVPKAIQKQFKTTHFHPSVLDALIQTFGILHVTTTEIDGITLPKAISSFVINMPPLEKMYAYCRLLKETPLAKHYNLLLLSVDGVIIAQIEDFYPNSTKVSETEEENLGYKLGWKQIHIPAQESSNVVQNRLVVIASKNFIDNFEQPRDGLVRENIIIENAVDNDSIFRQALQNSISSTRVIFAPFHRITNRNNDSMSVFLRSKNNLQNLTLLIKVLKEMKISVPVYIVTEEVMASSDMNINSSNISGAELWGMVRAVMREVTFLDLRLVDMTASDENVSIFSDILWSDEKGFHEYIIREGKLFHSDLAEVRSFEASYREVNFDPAETLSLQSGSPGDLTDVHLGYKQELNSLFDAGNRSCNENYCDILVHSVCVHNPVLYPVSTVVDSSEASIWPEINKSGCPVLCLEGVGTIVDGTAEPESYVSKHRTGFCYPTAVSTIVSVPNECTFDITETSAYVPGMMTVGVVVSNIAEICARFPSICIIVDEELKIFTDTITKIFSRQGKVVQIEDIESLSLSEENTPRAIASETLVILGNIMAHDTLTDMLPERFPKLLNIVSIEAYIPRASERVLKHQYKNVTINILKTEEFFTSSQLSTTVQELDKMFKSSTFMESSVLHSKIDNHAISVLKLPFPTLKIVEEKVPECKIPVKVTKKALFRQKGCYILVGGLTGLGWELLQLIAELGAGCIATISRRVPTPQHELDIKDLHNKFGCKTVFLQADISNFDQLENAFKKLQRQIDGNFKIRGVFHGGAVTRDMLLEDMNTEDMEKPLLPKILGTWNLHLVTKNMQLDFFVMQSSIVSVFGNRGQCNYAAGNAFQDAFAHFRRSLGLCGQSINWSTLAVGMATESKKLETYLQSQGFDFLSKEDIRRCFIRALMDNHPQMIFGRFDWKTLQDNGSIQVTSAKFSNFLKAEAKVTDRKASARNYKFNFEEYCKPSSNKRKIIEDLVISTISDILVIENSTLTKDSKFSAIGLDSMTTASFVNSIAKATRVRLPLDQIYDDSANIDSVTMYIIGHISNGAKRNVEADHIKGGNFQEDKKSVITKKEREKGMDNTLTNGFDTVNGIATQLTQPEMMSTDQKLRSRKSENILLADSFTFQNELLSPRVVSLIKESGSLFLQWNRQKDMRKQELPVKLVTEVEMKSKQAGDFLIRLRRSDEWIELKTGSEDTATRWFEALKEAINGNGTAKVLKA